MRKIFIADDYALVEIFRLHVMNESLLGRVAEVNDKGCT